jgi:hypothetical protein
MAGCSRVGTPVVEVDPDVVVVDPVVVVDWVEVVVDVVGQVVEAVVEVVVDAVVDVIVDAVEEVEVPPVVEVEAEVVVAESSVVSLPHPASNAAANDTTTSTRVIFMPIPVEEGPAAFMGRYHHGFCGLERWPERDQ